MLGFILNRRRPSAAPAQVAASTLAVHGARKRADADRQRRRDMADQIRADLRAKGKDCPPLEWPAL
ncbi:hypothetical protein V474_07850 [Novosphingobium barchaimii LL02]|uniref:Uncharacterized protein n=1 Tax=Novosphingobium barchaimii LL02 TaxID=1114963 RepID=A0A0J7Y7T1_9SPHN|nr:hypothetical protein [Novosphingobium barchaimii]KMS59994.1 hypothetical protein V474_07850 [Novosphingobium barchaimii LL02]